MIVTGCLNLNLYRKGSIQLILTVVQAIYPDASANELHAQLGYLEDKDLVDIDRQPDGHWHAKLNSNGIDVVAIS